MKMEWLRGGEQRIGGTKLYSGRAEQRKLGLVVILKGRLEEADGEINQERGDKSERQGELEREWECEVKASIKTGDYVDI